MPKRITIKHPDISSMLDLFPVQAQMFECLYKQF